MSEAVLVCSALAKTYQGPAPVEVLRGVELQVRAGERVAIRGRSGSGKSTLLHVLGGLDAPSAGTVTVQGRALSSMGEVERSRLRNETLGFIYQFHHLLPELSAVENVALPLWIRRMDRREALERPGEDVGEHQVERRAGAKRAVLEAPASDCGDALGDAVGLGTARGHRDRVRVDVGGNDRGVPDPSGGDR